MRHLSRIAGRARALPIGVLLLLAFAQPALALTWPNLSGVGACQTTLQNCIDTAAPGDTVLIGSDDFLFPDSYTAVNEDISINKSLTLAAATGIDAVFSPGRSIVVNSPSNIATSITLQHLVLQHGHVIVDHFSTADSSYFVDGLRIIETDAITACAIQFYDYGSGMPHFTVGNSSIELRHSALTSCAMSAQGNGGAWQGAFSGNRIRVENGSASSGPLSVINVSGTSAGTFRISSNQIVGRGFAGGININQLAGSAANTWYVDDNYIDGENVAPTSGFAGIFITPQNSELHVVNNTVTNGTQGLWIYPPSSSPDSSSGQVANNLVAFHSGGGLLIDSALSALGNRNNLVHANGSNFFTAGPGTATVDPLLVGVRNARLQGISPARNAGSNADIPAFTLDADGERRIDSSTVDIGAFEFSEDRAFIHVSSVSDASGNTTRINEAFADGVSDQEKILATPHHGSGDPTQLAQNIGIYLVNSSPLWALFHENTGVTMQPGQSFSVFAPLYGYGAFVHTTSAASVFGRYSKLPALDGNASAIAFVTHNWNPGGGGGTYHDHRVGLERFGSDWYIRNEDATVDMPVGVSFNVVVAPFLATANAWQIIAPSATARVMLSHLLLDDNACAAPQVTRVDDPLTPAIVNDDVPLSVQYVAGGAGAPGHWYIVAEGAGAPTFPAGAAFNVMVPGAQADACRDNDRIFADGFER